MIITSVVDTHAREAAASTNYGPLAKLWLNGGTAGNDKQAFVRFPRTVPTGATVLSAVLRLRLSGGWSGTNTVTVKRVTETWKEGRLTWNNRPNVTALHAGVEVVTGGASGDALEVDVTDIMQDVADAATAKFFGFRLELGENVDRALLSSDNPDDTLRPQLEITWSEAPDPPDNLHPDDGQAVSVQFPLLRWSFVDDSGNTVQASSQVQISSTEAELLADTPDYDTGKVANDEHNWDTNDGVFSGISVAATLFWRVRVWDATDFASDWSDPAEMTRVAFGALTIDNPGATVEETTPPVMWTLTGAAQESYRVTLSRVNDDGTTTQLWKVAATGATTEVTPPAGLIKTGETYRVTVEVWDDVDRDGDDHLTASQDFTYVRDGTPTATTGLTAVTTAGSPGVVLTWQRAAAPDYWSLVVDGVEVDDRIDVSDTFVSGTTYTYTYWGAAPRDATTYEVEAVVQSAPGDPYLHSDGNATATATTKPLGVWLVDTTDDSAVMLGGRDAADFAIGESATTYNVIGGQSPVRITDVVRGYEGSFSGTLLSASDRTTFLELKRRAVGGRQLVLVVGDLSIPVQLEDAAVNPTPSGDGVYSASFSFFQSGPPWPVDA